jgi:hypothetical protein
MIRVIPKVRRLFASVNSPTMIESALKLALIIAACFTIGALGGGAGA